MSDPRRVVPVLVDVIKQPEFLIFTSRLPSGRLMRQTVQRPVWLRPGEDLDNPDALPCLTVWSRCPVTRDIPPPSEWPVVLAQFEVDPDTAEGAAAIAALGMKRWTQPRTRA
ncbi:hypothetical protein [Deinococcus humi]|uniref:Uncharacterized protein n=1 Tax=Deinococcus humi TaxID=662880 RepID=A0A7W8NEB2_9DEIO|nr:hypothetical protein [Deinococcus humi]MBB5362505.1 hypothetical protein [Deinococcus humi]GGO28486.1 hypothetical protein GCM10008949_21160 [Deinococcus humi]